MADNVVSNSGDSGGPTFATDDISSVHYPRVKLSLGADGSATDALDGAGNVASGVQRVTLANDDPAVVALQILDDWDETNRAAVNLVSGQAGVAAGNGTVSASTLRVTVASDTTGVLSVDDNGSSLTVDTTGTAGLEVIQATAADLNVTEANSTAILADTASMDTNLGTLAGAVSGTEMQVDVVAALPAGTNAIGKLAANSGVDIGDVDVTSISAGSNLVGDVGISGARTSGGTTLYKNIDVDESEDQIKGTAGQLYWIHAMNLASGTRFLKFYNATAASVTVGTTVPDLTLPLPTQGDTNGAGFTLTIPNGIAFDTAITVAATTGVADNDSGAPGANEVVVNLGYA